MSRIVEYFKSDMRNFAMQLSAILEEFGATPENDAGRDIQDDTK
jgi:hypothetical protein